MKIGDTVSYFFILNKMDKKYNNEGNIMRHLCLQCREE